MAVSTFDVFKIGIGPSSSHTVGPMKAAERFIHRWLLDPGRLHEVARIRADVYGSLALTGRGHGTDKAILLGLEGQRPNLIDPDIIPATLERIRSSKRIQLMGQHEIAFDEKRDLGMNKRQKLPYHTNGMRFTAYNADDEVIATRDYYSVGGGFVVNQDDAADDRIVPDETPLPYPFKSGDELLAQTARSGLSIAQLMFENEKCWRSEDEIRAQLREIWSAMQSCVTRGIREEGVLPGGLKVGRRAPALYRELSSKPEAAMRDPLTTLDWVNLYALAVNEENAAGGRVVTAPTNGAAGVLPAVLHYFDRFCPGANEQRVFDFLLTSAAIGILYKENAFDFRCRSGLPGRSGRGLLDGGRWPGRGAGWQPEPDRERRGNRHGTQPGPDLRPDRRPGADSLHRAQCNGRGEGDQCLAHGDAWRRQAQGVAGQGHQDHARYRPRHAGQVQGNQPRWPGGERHRVLRATGSGAMATGHR